jgi:hypothetical protein
MNPTEYIVTNYGDYIEQLKKDIERWMKTNNDQMFPTLKEMRELADELRQLLGIEYVGHVTDTQLRVGRESLQEIIEAIKGMK